MRPKAKIWVNSDESLFIVRYVGEDECCEIWGVLKREGKKYIELIRGGEYIGVWDYLFHLKHDVGKIEVYLGGGCDFEVKDMVYFLLEVDNDEE